MDSHSPNCKQIIYLAVINAHKIGVLSKIKNCVKYAQ